MAQVLDLATDKDLTERALGGDTHAFDELYRRHVGAAWRLAQAITRDEADASDAVSEGFARVFDAMRRGIYQSDSPFRPYLLTTTRNAAIDAARKASHAVPASGDPVLELREHRPRHLPAETVEQGADAAFVASAFDGLPERWRAVLWLTEVEGMRPRDAAPLLGLSSNATSQLAVRARAGLRERYLQAHVSACDDHECRRTVSHLGAYAAGNLAPRDIAKVDQHLAACAACRARLDALEDAGMRLRGILLPLPLALAAATSAKWAGVVGASAPSGLALVLPGGDRLPAWAQRAVIGAAAAGVAAGVLAATLFGARDVTRSSDLASPTGRIEEPIDGDDDGDDDRDGDDDGSAPSTPAPIDLSRAPVVTTTTAPPDDAGATPPPATSGETPRSPEPPTTPEEPSEPPPPPATTEGLQVDVATTALAVGVGTQTGVKVGPVVIGEPPDEPDSPIEIGLGGLPLLP